jgi:hypothetical protein
MTSKSEESTRHFIDYTWKDIHHSRLQNWTGITVVTAFHIGILKIIDLLRVNNHLMCINRILLGFGAAFCLIGFLITRIHQQQLYKKLDWIINAEKSLKTIRFVNDTEKNTKLLKLNKLKNKIVELEVKMNKIEKIEKKKKLEETIKKLKAKKKKIEEKETNNTKPSFLKRNFWTAGALMGYFYLLLMILDILFIIISIPK